MFYACRQMLTLVAYPVSMHQDYTAKLPSLENKKCFVVSGRGMEGVGRGGAGKNKIVAAFLDWSSDRAGCSRYDFLAATGLTGAQVRSVTRQLWITHFGFTHEEFRRSADNNENVEGTIQNQEGHVIGN